MPRTGESGQNNGRLGGTAFPPPPNNNMVRRGGNVCEPSIGRSVVTMPRTGKSGQNNGQPRSLLLPTTTWCGGEEMFVSPAAALSVNSASHRKVWSEHRPAGRHRVPSSSQQHMVWRAGNCEPNIGRSVVTMPRTGKSGQNNGQARSLLLQTTTW
jgi:hypothetical protein